jgi:hypothetical protein
MNLNQIAETVAELAAAKRDIAALLWLDGNCEYCEFGLMAEYSGAKVWRCGLEPGQPCEPVWRGLKEGAADA